MESMIRTSTDIIRDLSENMSKPAQSLRDDANL